MKTSRTNTRKSQVLGDTFEGEMPSLTSLDDHEKMPRAGFTRRLADGRTIKVKPTKVKRPSR